MGSDWPVDVSGREAEVLAALGEHLSNAQIAHRLHISVRTVESHVSSLLRKFGVTDRRSLSAFADQAAAGAPARAGRLAGVPESRTTFVGRERDGDAVVAALAEDRLVSLLGPGGVGKTRLAAVVAAAAAPSFPSGGAFVDLVPVRCGFVTQAVAGALGVTERPPRPLEHAVVERLRRGRSLLILDSCEHLVDEVSGLVGRVLSGCPQTAVVATSRERLGVPGERTVHVPPLPLGSDAERLFLDRARAVDPGFAADPSVVSDLCARLDGMPLAIELAAARAASLGADGLRTAIEDRLRLLTGGRGPDERHRSLRAVIGWSHDLLEEEERALFRRLGVFVGGFDLDAATAVSPGADRSVVADLVGRLVDKSLVVRGRAAESSRWRLLETIRAFAVEQLVAGGEQDEARRRYLAWGAAAAADIEDRLTGDWRARFDEVAADLRAAVGATVAEPDATAHRLARSLAHLTFARGFFVEARGHYRAAAERAADAADASQDLRRAADAAVEVSDGHDAFELLLDAAELARSVGDGNARANALAQAVIVAHRFPAGLAADMPRDRTATLLRAATEVADPDDPHVTALVLAARAWDEGSGPFEPDAALARAAVDAARRAGDPVLLLGALDALSSAAASAGRMREAHRIASQRLPLLDAIPRHEPYAAIEVIDAYYVASSYAVCVGDLPAAIAVARQAATDDPTEDHPYFGSQRILALALTGRFDEASHQASTMWDSWRRDGSPPREWMSPHAAAAALVHGLLGDDELDLWRARALEIARVDDPAESGYLAAFAAFVDARLAVHTGRLHAAPALVERAFAAFPRRWYETYARAAGAELAVVAGLPDAAARLETAAPCAAENDWAAACLTRASGRLNVDPDALTHAIEGWERIGARFERACTLLLLPETAPEGHSELHALGCPPPAAG